LAARKIKSKTNIDREHISMNNHILSNGYDREHIGIGKACNFLFSITSNNFTYVALTLQVKAMSRNIFQLSAPTQH
jgi:hypothetical protein